LPNFILIRTETTDPGFSEDNKKKKKNNNNNNNNNNNSNNNNNRTISDMRSVPALKLYFTIKW